MVWGVRDGVCSGWGVFGLGGGHGGFKRRIEAFVKIKKKMGGGSGRQGSGGGGSGWM